MTRADVPKRVDGRTARAERTREAIVTAHLELVGEGDLRPTGERIAELAGVSLRALWTNQSIVFDGQYDQVIEAGLNPLPVQQPIPIWIGGYAEATLRRIAISGDGWFPWREPNEAMAETLERLWTYTREAGRDPSEIGLEPKLDMSSGPPDVWHAYVEGWRRLGASHLCVNTMRAGLRSPGEHIAAIEQVARELGIQPG